MKVIYFLFALEKIQCLFELIIVCGGSRGGSGGSVEPPKLNVM